jgi:hypothetical protein
VGALEVIPCAVEGAVLADAGFDGAVPFLKGRVFGVVEVFLAKLVSNLDEAGHGEDAGEFPPRSPVLKEVSDAGKKGSPRGAHGMKIDEVVKKRKGFGGGG